MNLHEAEAYLESAHESESELRAEYGMGAVSLGYDAAEWAPAYDGYRVTDDPTYAEALAVLEAADDAAFEASQIPIPSFDEGAADGGRASAQAEEAFFDDIPF